jgi:elongation factor P
VAETVNTNQFKNGMHIELDGGVWRIVEFQHVKPGKGGAYAQVELKDIRGGTKLNERFRSSESVERVRLDQKNYQFLFADGDAYTFMDNETYEQITLNRELIGDAVQFLQDGMTVTIESFEEQPISVMLPEHVVLEVVEADAVVKGRTASA